MDKYIRNCQNIVNMGDRKLYEALSNKLNSKDIYKIKIIDNNEIEKIVQHFERKKENVLSLFKDNFSVNETKIRRQILDNKIIIEQKDLYSEVANKILITKINNIVDNVIKENKDFLFLDVVFKHRRDFIVSLLEHNYNIKNLEIEDFER